MNFYRLANGLTLILLAICVSLIFIIYTELQSGQDLNAMSDSNSMKNKKVESETGILNNISSTDVSISQFSEVLNRPLFVEGRMPYEEEQTENISVTVLSPLKLSLEGVVLSPQSKVAVVKDLSNNEIMRLGIGMSHNGWRVKTIEPQTVEFERNGEVQSIDIELAKDSESQRKAGYKLPIKRKGRPSPRNR
jgi:type II secretory pathway component PulC